MKTIAIIDDDIYIGNMIEEVLQQEGYHVLRAYSGTEAVLLFSKQHPDLVLLDLMLPGMNGEDVLPHLDDIPVIVISAKIDARDKVTLLRSGAVDYITKPCDIDELLARIEVQFRNKVTSSSSIHYFDKIKLNPSTYETSWEDVPIHLTQTEYAILKLLMKNPKQVMTKSAILDFISEDTPDCNETSLKVHVSNLRKKLKEVSALDYIESVWGIGFRMKSPE